MAWEFSTDPEFQAQLDWMARVRPRGDLAARDARRGARTRPPCCARSRRSRSGCGSGACGPPTSTRSSAGQGFGQLKLGLMHEVLGTSPIAPLAFGNAAPDSGNSEILALAGTPEQKDRWLHPLLAGDLRSAFSMTEPDTAGSDPTLLQTRAERDGDEWVINGHKWFSSNGSIADFLIVMAVTSPDARPHQRASMFIVPVDTPGVEIVRDVRDDGASRGGVRRATAATPRSHYRDVRVGPEALLGAEGAGFLIAQQRLVPGPHPPLHALARGGRASLRHALRARARALRPRLAARREGDRAELDRGLRGRDAGRPADDAARRLEDGHGGRRWPRGATSR